VVASVFVPDMKMNKTALAGLAIPTLSFRAIGDNFGRNLFSEDLTRIDNWR